ncbi:MAG: hypothetical protein JNL70_09240 [Saprospiraceae bacterium]|nr:hypothetical protein [Saprospiraceae bacterium]
MAAILVLLAAQATPSVSQLPVTQVFCFDMERDGAGINVKNARYMTAFNPRGYNNQPQWMNNNELYLSVQTPLDTSQTEVLSLSLLNNTAIRVTATAESEYSPTPMLDRRSFSCIRADVAAAGGTQRLWAYPLDRSNGGRDLLPLQQNIGYHCWLSDKKVALFIVNGQENYLKITNIEDQTSIELTKGIGRSLARMKDGKLAFVQKATAQTWYIKSLDPNTYESQILIETLPNAEDYALLPDGTFIMGYASKLYGYNPADATKEWRELVDLSKYGLTNIKRLAISRDQDKIAIVNDITPR